MEIRELAERVLFSDRLADKLWTPADLTDDAPGAALVKLDTPTRPTALAFAAREDRASFPGPGRIRDVQDVGETLHYFANHELLATELMALCLLKFPDAPKAFRLAVANTLKEEQEHVRLYCDRMEACGVRLGDVAVGDYFWRVTAPMTDPSQYLARMSLTFEQANLDYSGFYGELFRRLGDDETAALMQRVYEDEIRHVRLGLTWFNRWSDEKGDLFARYAAALDRPLSPVRARGIGFNREGRRAAGLPEAFIDQVAVFGGSRGRSPDVYSFDHLAEERCRAAGARENAAVRRLGQDLAILPMTLASADDVVVVPELPTLAHLGRLADAGLPIPEFVEVAPGSLSGRRVRQWRPWAWTPAESARLQALDAVEFADSAKAAADLFANFANKGAWLSFRTELLAAATVPTAPLAELAQLTTSAKLDAALADLRRAGVTQAMVKPAFGAAGRDNLVLSTTAPSAKLKASVDHWVVEPFWTFEALGSTQLEVDAARVRILGDTVMQVGSAGKYAGTIAGAVHLALPESVRRFLYGNGRAGIRALHAAAAAVGERLRSHGYLGPVGVDWGVGKAADGSLFLQPVIEVNPRFTMGRIALALAKQTVPGRIGNLALVPPKYAREHTQSPIKVENRTGKPLISEGTLPISDPATAHVITAIWSARS